MHKVAKLRDGDFIRFTLPKEKTQEAYFGANNPFASEAKSIVGEIRSIWVNTRQGSDRKGELIGRMSDSISRLGDCIARNTGAGKCQVGIIADSNAFCLPMCWDDNFKSGKMSRDEREKFAISLEDIIETSNGYRFRTPTGKVLIIGLGMGLFSNLTDDEVTAFLFHEIGHSFQHMLVGVNANVAWERLHSTLEHNRFALNLFSLLVTMGFGIFELRSVRDDKHIVKQGDANLGTAVVVKSDADTVDRSNMEEELDKSVDSTVTNYYGKKERKTPLILRALFGLTVGVISGIISLIYLMLRPLFIIINPSTLYEKANGKYYRKAKMFEEFADSFVASYGLGPSLTSGLAKLTKDAGVVDLKTLSFLNYVPILNLYLAWSSSWAEADLSLRHGYATSSNRLATGYQTLDYELGHNKDLSDGDKKDIKAQMDEMAKTYDQKKQRPGAKNFTFKLIHQIVNKKIDDEKTDIKENILDILQAHKDEIEKLPSIDPDLQGDMAEAMKKSMRQFSQDALAALKTAKVEQ